MIIDNIINFLLSPLYTLFESLNFPEIDPIIIPEDAFAGIQKFLANVAYVVPIRVILPMLIFNFALDHFTVIWALINKIKSWIPGMGG